MIEAKQILEAYKEKGLEPVRRLWGNEVKKTACGLGVLCYQRCGEIPLSAEEIAERLGLSDSFVAGFIDYWDHEGNGFGYEPLYEETEYRRGEAVAAEALRVLRDAGYDI